MKERYKKRKREREEVSRLLERIEVDRQRVEEGELY